MHFYERLLVIQVITMLGTGEAKNCSFPRERCKFPTPIDMIVGAQNFYFAAPKFLKTRTSILKFCNFGKKNFGKK